MSQFNKEQLLSKLNPKDRDILDSSILYTESSASQFNSNCRLFLITSTFKLLSLSDIKIASIKKEGKGLFYWDNKKELQYKPLPKGCYLLFEPVSKVRQEMENILSDLESGKLIIKKKSVTNVKM